MIGRMLVCGLLLGTFGCGAAEGEDLGESQAALLVDNQVLRINTSGKCVLYDGVTNRFKTLDCPAVSPFPDAKRFDFIGTSSGFRVQSNEGKCITAPPGIWEGIPLDATSLCSPDSYSTWKVRSGGNLTGTFQLESLEYSGKCMAEDLTQAGAYLRLATCATSYPAKSKQVMILDPYSPP